MRKWCATPPNVQKVYVELEIHNLANCQVLAPMILELHNLIKDNLRFCFPHLPFLYSGILGNWTLCALAAQYKTISLHQTPYAQLFFIFKITPDSCSCKNNLTLVVEILQVLWDKYWASDSSWTQSIQVSSPPYKLQWANRAIMRQSVILEMWIGNVVHVIFCMVFNYVWVYWMLELYFKNPQRAFSRTN